MAAPGLRTEARLASAPVRGEFLLAERMVANLLDNAVCHNVADGSVWVTSGTEAGKAVLTVVNTGPVIPPGDVARLLQPFQRRAPARVRSRLRAGHAPARARYPRRPAVGAAARRCHRHVNRRHRNVNSQR